MVVMYGGAPDVGDWWPLQPSSPPGFPSNWVTCPGCGIANPPGGCIRCALEKPQAAAPPQHPRVSLPLPGERRADVVAGLAALLPRLRDALRGGPSLSEDEVLAMVWLEGPAAGHGDGE